MRSMTVGQRARLRRAGQDRDSGTELHLYSGVSKDIFTEKRDVWIGKIDSQNSTHRYLLVSYIQSGSSIQAGG